MEMPKLFKVSAFINILFIIIYLVIGLMCAVLLSDTSMMNIFWINFTVCANLSWIFGILSTVFWLRRSVLSYSLLLYYFVMEFIPVIMLISIFSLIKGSSDQMDMKPFIIMVAVMSVNPLLLLFMLIRPLHVRWVKTNGSLRKLVLRPAILIPVAVTFIAVNVFFVGISKIGINGEISPEQMRFLASSVLSGSSLENAYDGKTATSWIPGFKEGINEWIKIEIREDLPVDRIAISFSDEGEFGSYSRGKNIVVETSDGTRSLSELKDEKDYQTIPLGNKHIAWVKLKFMSTYKGKVEDALHVSEIKVYTKNTGFVKMSIR